MEFDGVCGGWAEVKWEGREVMGNPAREVRVVSVPEIKVETDENPISLC